MKVIEEVEKSGDLKGIVFLTNEVPFKKQMEIDKLTTQVYEKWNKTNKLSIDDIIVLKNNAEISTAKIAGNVIEINKNIKYEIHNELNKEKTEWILSFIVYDKNKTKVFDDFEKSLNYIVDNKSIKEWITESEINLYTIYT